MDDKVNVTLTGPAKVNGVREPAGKTVTVSTTLALQLAASGVINPEAAKALSVAIAEPPPLGSDFDAAVRAAVADREANWATAMDHFETMAEDTLNAALADLQNKNGLLTEVEAKADTLQALLADAETKFSDLEARLTAEAARADAAEKALMEKPATAKPAKTPK
ncbi:hypothetical protein J5N58_16755 [Rhizobium cremeum]|uniref:hypothetical protein n=1 Tax=Rhizobium cremeum TaxID=2813827 RepID=UPI001FD1CC83|nr:hypothetical protein [Rhizobium cremeum]MCJ7996070.1 hypothetical protein [Rhizobium cremeum]MCJ8001329.1 hypothetical protein [Rhizobium cremeum]